MCKILSLAGGVDSISGMNDFEHKRTSDRVEHDNRMACIDTDASQLSAVRIEITYYSSFSLMFRSSRDY
jgi:hypothetical protein